MRCDSINLESPESQSMQVSYTQDEREKSMAYEEYDCFNLIGLRILG